MKKLMLPLFLAAVTCSISTMAEDSKSRFVSKSAIEEALTGEMDAETVSLRTGDILVAIHPSGLVGISPNGRYRFDGTITDMWANRTIDTLADARESFNTIPLERIDLQPRTLDAYTVGTGEPEVFAFISPTHPETVHVMDTIRATANDFTYHIVPIPDSQTSQSDAIPYACASDKQQVVNSLFTGGSPADIETRKDCYGEVLAGRMIVFQLLGLSQLPSLIMPNGRVESGEKGKAWQETVVSHK